MHCFTKTQGAAKPQILLLQAESSKAQATCSNPRLIFLILCRCQHKAKSTQPWRYQRQLPFAFCEQPRSLWSKPTRFPRSNTSLDVWLLEGFLGQRWERLSFWAWYLGNERNLSWMWLKPTRFCSIEEVEGADFGYFGVWDETHTHKLFLSFPRGHEARRVDKTYGTRCWGIVYRKAVQTKNHWVWDKTSGIKVPCKACSDEAK